MIMFFRLLPIFPNSRFTSDSPWKNRPLALVDLAGLDVEAPRVGVGRCLDVALVHQPAEGLARAQVAEVEEHLVPEPRVEEVQHRVLHAADVEVDAAGVALELRPHPVALHLGVDEGVLVGGVQVAQLVPARPGPVGHGAELAAVRLRPVAQVEHDLHPVVGAAQRRLRLGRGVVDVERARRVVVDLGQQHGQLVVGHGDGEVVLVEHDRERLAPVALP